MNSWTSEQVSPVRCGLKFKPPLLSVIYKDITTGKLRKRTFPLHGIRKANNVQSVADSLLSNPKHTGLLNTLPRQQLESLLQRLLDAHKRESDTTPVPSPLHSSLLQVPPLTPTKQEAQQLDEDFNAAIAELLGDSNDGALDETIQDPGHDSRDKAMEEQPSSSIRVTSDEPKPSPKSTLPPLGKLPPLLPPVESTPGYNMESVLRQTGVFDEAPAGEEPEYSADFQESEKTDPRPGKQLEDKSLSFAIEDLDEDDGSLSLSTGENLLDGSLSGEDFRSLNIVTPTPDAEGPSRPPMEDLNKANDQYLSERKQEMDTKFRENQLKPGDAGYQYDKEIDFEAPKIESGWDSQSDCSYSDF